MTGPSKKSEGAERFGMVFRGALPHLRRLSPSAVLVYLALLTYRDKDSGIAYPATGTIARDCALDKRTVKRALRRLESTGWITNQGQDSPTSRVRYFVAQSEIPAIGVNEGVAASPPPGWQRSPSRGGQVMPEGGGSAAPQSDHTKQTRGQTTQEDEGVLEQMSAFLTEREDWHPRIKDKKNRARITKQLLVEAERAGFPIQYLDLLFEFARVKEMKNPCGFVCDFLKRVSKPGFEPSGPFQEALLAGDRAEAELQLRRLESSRRIERVEREKREHQIQCLAPETSGLVNQVVAGTKLPSWGQE